ncbi:MAG TPA: ABC transporter ATP-binding protein [Candidatus Cloacimonadota bacterium]|nr:ABC transporter ATP-binding protein [Candidatus Cloacimonadota bacterium]
MPNTILTAANLKKYYAGTKAVDDVSIELMEGEILAILGPNGAGKTTTLEMLEGLRQPDSGTIGFFEENWGPSQVQVKERIGVQLQSSSFFRYLNVRETLELFRGLYANQVPVKELIAVMSLEEKEKTLVKNLSGGQLQRLALAVALVNDPRLIFLDEPTTGLDPQARRSHWETVLDLRKRGKTIILTTHYMEEAEYLADRIIIMDHGKIVASGTLDELISSIGAQNYISFRIPGMSELPAQLSGLQGIEHGEGDGFCLQTDDVTKDLASLFELAQAQDFKLDDIRVRRPDLDDVFLRITGHTLRD